MPCLRHSLVFRIRASYKHAVPPELDYKEIQLTVRKIESQRDDMFVEILKPKYVESQRDDMKRLSGDIHMPCLRNLTIRKSRWLCAKSSLRETICL